MSESTKPVIGTIGWADLTVPNATEIRDFYLRVVGWEFASCEVGGYSDFNLLSPADGTPRAGVCHARGGNADLPAQWLIYITVADLDASIAQCVALGGKVIAGPKGVGHRYCVIQDPAGAVAALFEAGQ